MGKKGSSNSETVNQQGQAPAPVIQHITNVYNTHNGDKIDKRGSTNIVSANNIGKNANIKLINLDQISAPKIPDRYLAFII